MTVSCFYLMKPLVFLFSILKYLFFLLTDSIQLIFVRIRHLRKNDSNQNSSSSPLFAPVVNEQTGSAQSSSVKHTKVLILGGGIAGVTAAYTLDNNGMEDFILLEASDKLGGRISQADFCGHKIEEGANWIHGVNKGHNPILELARECKLKIFEMDDDSLSARNSKGENITADVKKAIASLQDVCSRVDDIVDKRGLAGGPPPPDGHLKPKGELPDCSVSVAERELVGWVAKTPEQLTAEYFVHDWDDSVPPTQTGLLGDQLYLTDDVFGRIDGMVVDPKGYISIVNSLAEQTFDDEDPRLILRETVREVQLNADPDASDPAASADEPICVRTVEGHEYRAQYCIITFSNAVLVSGNVHFTPSLPEWKLRALKQCPMGVYAKVFIKFADNVRPFWDPTQWIMFVDNQQAEGDQAASATAPGNADKLPTDSNGAPLRRDPRGFYTGWVNVSHKGIYPGSNMLVTMLVDDLGKATELKTPEQLKVEVTAILRRMYGKDVPEPEAIHCTKWSTNPLTLGSFPILHCGSTFADLKNLTLPVDNLYFAGDGSGVDFTGCVQQAYISGVHRARDILKELQVTSAARETSIAMNM